ncbi:hypothetical protein GCM10017673_14150 [Streptosporangium violaceochromogenes]|nr:hypothetical protein GCM10017673_14150 [Streptosporangium violaceochromogenes]
MNVVGAWRLVEWRITRPDGRVTHPFGPDATGLLCYTGDGHMSLTLARAARPPLSGTGPAGACPKARAEVFASFFSYSGRYEVREGHVAHDVEMALDPALAGTTRVGEMNFDGRRLVLAAPADGTWHTLIWRRA